MPNILSFTDIAEFDSDRVGGKGLSLARMLARGLPVPPGFVVTTDAYRQLHERGIDSDASFTREFADAYQKLGGGTVAVRSSATDEDGAVTSFAGQQATFLGVSSLQPVIDAVAACWRSLRTERAVAYRARQGVDDTSVAMAVVVQQLVAAEVAGVLFTRDPLDPKGERILVEASWGLGESVVSGRVTPDRFHVDFATGRMLDQQLGSKRFQVTEAGEAEVSPERREQFCLGEAHLAILADLARMVEHFYGAPRDIEWAFAGGKFYLLQARPITAATAVERETLRHSIIAEMKRITEPTGTVWARFNLSEVLPNPTPMTWAIVQKLVGADGGFGMMNRDLGAKPDPSLGSLSAFDLVSGRPMVNLSRLPRMQFARPPIEYPFAMYKDDPRKALDPKPTLRPLQGGILGLFRLPATIWRLFRFMRASNKLSATFADQFGKEIVPPFVVSTHEAIERNWSTLSPAQLIAEVRSWSERTLVEFARHSLKPTAFADLAWNNVLEILRPRLGEERARATLGEISVGAHPPPEADLATAVRELTEGKLDRGEFLQRFGNRGANEMELAQPRWREVPDEIDRIATSGTSSRSHTPTVQASIDAIAAEAKLSGPLRDRFLQQARQLRSYLGLREAAKHYLLLGYAVIRRALVELDGRFHLRGGIFYLTPDDLDTLVAGKDFTATIAAARRRRQIELSLEIPPVLFSDDLEAIGRPAPEPVGGVRFEGIALSAGVAEGPALVLAEPIAPSKGLSGYILVCPSTDPAWVSLFVRAAGLVMESGGVLSHGAIVAREFGLPAVAGLPNITKILRNGQIVRVDASRGIVSVIDGAISE